MSWQQAEVRELKEGRYVLIDDQPCKILSITTSKPGKHGEAKARIEAVGVFDGQRRSMVHPVKHKIQVPQMDKRKAQVLSISGNEVQLMDLETFETFHLKIDEEQKAKLVIGSETFYVSSMGMRKIFEL
ncbi:MAG: translation initiation factor IF-5A [Candidatus Thermoplasmatota archaeon]|jgi:translation initiation factor 5A|nr:translation initiation factor IF-5A [Candidatus Sysuiplasma jiujiangense]MBX8640650.1 translation initiation factor IF-5A [Candidatus Sysuiplasma jiujiangense]MBX8642675.1 translation initiation factor IF-5A [Candidatus Sysuiplasma jiujiangense]MCL4317678.1 translation initiation factor IF-5A [Candidatus Thermoplasmatota archaeon]